MIGQRWTTRATQREKDGRGPYLPKVSDIKEIKDVKQVALLHGEHRVAGREERADVLQTQELQRQQCRPSVFMLKKWPESFKNPDLRPWEGHRAIQYGQRIKQSIKLQADPVFDRAVFKKRAAAHSYENKSESFSVWKEHNREPCAPSVSLSKRKCGKSAVQHLRRRPRCIQAVYLKPLPSPRLPEMEAEGMSSLPCLWKAWKAEWNQDCWEQSPFIARAHRWRRL